MQKIKDFKIKLVTLHEVAFLDIFEQEPNKINFVYMRNPIYTFNTNLYIPLLRQTVKICERD